MRDITFQLIDSGWDQIIRDSVGINCAELRVVCPFIKLRTARRLLAAKCPEQIQVITRFHLGEMCDGVNDTEALRLLLENGAQIRGIRGLHAKLYLFGDRRAVVTSANLTEAAMLRNHEFGFISSQPDIIQGCRDYFDTLWARCAGSELSLERLKEWQVRITAVRVTGSRPSLNHSLPDEGAAATNVEAPGLPPAVPAETWNAAEAQQSFVKFFGQGNDRVELSTPVLEEVRGSGSHWACTYSKHPRGVAEGAVMFMAHFVENPHDTIIYGRATAMRHVRGRDEASAAEILQRSWKKYWPMYVRVHHAEFVAGTLANGVLLSELIDALGSDAFAPSQRRARAGISDVNPRNSLRQQPAVELTSEAFQWLSERLEAAFAEHGKLTPAELETLDWPVLPWQRFDAYCEWLQKSAGLKDNTAREYAYFLTRYEAHYEPRLDETTVPDEDAANRLLERIRQVVGARGRWVDGTFNDRDVSQNLSPALRAFGRFNRSMKTAP